jgi:hypothetical protein
VDHRPIIDAWLTEFGLEESIRDHVAAVLRDLPDAVRADLMDDPQFVMCDYEPGPRATLHVPMKFAGDGGPARAVVLKRTLRGRPADFTRWIIAHEFAHAYLRHGGRWPHDDPEHAADSLAAAWGFPRPANSRPAASAH